MENKHTINHELILSGFCWFRR